MIKKIAKASEDVASESLEKWRAVFPQFVKDGEIDFDALKAFFQGEGSLAGTEKYGLNWAGKSNAFQAIRASATGTLTPQEKESKDFEKTENIFIEGDNLEVLKLLQKKYREQIKMIYIDPPYNTGKDFIYTDNFTENKSDYYERTGQSENGIRLTSNPESNGRYHSDWLTMIYPRLFLARNLLRDDGVIFVSIDDNEVANLRLIMDEIFGEENFVATIVWEKKYTRSNDAKFFSENHDYVLMYVKSCESFEMNLQPRTESQENAYANPDNDPRGRWKATPLHAKSGNVNNFVYSFSNGVKWSPPPNTYPRFSKERFISLEKNNEIWFGENGKSIPSRKSFLSEVKAGVTPVTIWSYSEVGHNHEANNEIKNLTLGGVFDNPKPTRLIKRMLELATHTGEADIILDFFVGSGTTAHAVMDLNAEDGGNRQWICVQIPEETDEESEAHKAGYKTIAEISRERIRRSGAKIGKGDIGFKAFALTKSNYTEWNVLTDQDDAEALKKQAKLFIDQPLVAGYDEESVVYEILIKEGFDLNAKVIQEKGALQPWVITDDEKKLTLTFADKVTKEQVENLKLSPSDTFVCFDSALDDTTKVNISRNLNVKVI